MLTLTRKLGERIFIILPDGREIVVEVREIRRSQVRIGIEADRDIHIERVDEDTESNR